MKTFQIEFFEDWAVNIVGDPLPTNQEQQKQYLDSDIIDDINNTALKGGEVIIDDEKKTIYILRSDGVDFNLSGTDFDEMLNDVPHGVSIENYLLWLSHTW